MTTTSERAKAWLDRWGLRWNAEGGTIHMPPGSGSALAEVDLMLQFEAVIAEEREACAKVAAECEPSEQWPDGYGPVQTDIAAAIRART